MLSANPKLSINQRLISGHMLPGGDHMRPGGDHMRPGSRGMQLSHPHKPSVPLLHVTHQTYPSHTSSHQTHSSHHQMDSSHTSHQARATPHVPVFSNLRRWSLAGGHLPQQHWRKITPPDTSLTPPHLTSFTPPTDTMSDHTHHPNPPDHTHPLHPRGSEFQRSMTLPHSNNGFLHAVTSALSQENLLDMKPRSSAFTNCKFHPSIQKARSEVALDNTYLERGVATTPSLTCYYKELSSVELLDLLLLISSPQCKIQTLK